jgi:hypothetical protein
LPVSGVFIDGGDLRKEEAMNSLLIALAVLLLAGSEDGKGTIGARGDGRDSGGIVLAENEGGGKEGHGIVLAESTVGNGVGGMDGAGV